MEISEIDALDQSERLKDIRAQIDAHYENKDDRSECYELSVDLDALPREEDEEERSYIGETSEAVKMYRRLSSGEARLRVMELRLNHAQLQVSALRGEHERLQTEVEDLQLAGAEGEEHRLLLEARLRDVSEFEGGGAEETGLEQLRGALLAAADQHIRSMGAEMRQLRREVSGRSIAANEELAEKESEVVALREQLQSLSDQLAQRTVLYSAVDRRYRDEVRTRELTETELVAENRNLTARLQQLERQYSDVDGQRVEALLTVRQQRDTIAKLETEEASARARTQALDEELMTITTQCQTLQRVVEQLRGSDLEALEKDMAAEVEAVRQASRSKEDELRRQLGEARDLLQGESARRDALFAEMEQLRRERDEKEELLHMLENEGGRGREYGFGDVKERSNAVNNAVTTMLGVLTDLIDHVQRQKECTDRSALLQSMEAVALALCKEMHGEHVHEEAVVFRLRELFSAQEHGPSDNAAPGDSSSLDVNFLTGRDEYSEELILKHRALESELQSAQQREAQLKQAIHDQGDKMAIVLRRTAEFESNVVARVRGERNEEMEQLRRKLVEAMEESNLLRRHLEDARIELRVQEEELRRRHEDEAMRTRLLESLTAEQSRTRRCVDKLWTALQLRLQEEKVDNGDIGASLNGDDSGIEEICRQLLVLLQRHDEDAISDKKKGINDALPHLHNKITTKVRDIEAQTEDTVTLPAPPPHLLRSLLLSLSALRASTAAIKQDLTLQVLNLEDSCRMHINQILALVLKNSKGTKDANDMDVQLHKSKVERMRAEAHRDMAKYRRKVREKVRSRVAALRAQFDDERESILRMVRDECASILQEARSMLDQRQQQQKEAAAFSSSSSGPLLYPEMISPEQTLELVQSVLRKSQTLSEEEWREIYLSQRSGVTTDS